ncbi:hypothetical protein OKW44_002244 [Paraburkholderia sp. WSM4174]
MTSAWLLRARHLHNIVHRCDGDRIPRWSVLNEGYYRTEGVKTRQLGRQVTAKLGIAMARESKENC